MADSDFRRAHEEAISQGLHSRAKEEMEAFDLDEVAYARKRMKESLVTAVVTMTEIAECADFDTPVELLKLRFNAAKYLLDRAFGSVSPTSGEHADREQSPLEAFLDGITYKTD